VKHEVRVSAFDTAKEYIAELPRGTGVSYEGEGVPSLDVLQSHLRESVRIRVRS